MIHVFKASIGRCYHPLTKANHELKIFRYHMLKRYGNATMLKILRIIR